MRLIRLERLVDVGYECTLGIMVDAINGQTLCKTLELPWRDNARNISRFPAGCYLIRPYTSGRFGACFAFSDAETRPRTALRIHAGNSAKDTSGCILVGERFGPASVLASRVALNALRKELGEPFVLHAVDPKR